jgi:hypothetical protein
MVHFDDDDDDDDDDDVVVVVVVVQNILCNDVERGSDFTVLYIEN